MVRTRLRNVEQILFDVAEDFGLSCRIGYETYDKTTRIRLHDPKTDRDVQFAIPDEELAYLRDEARFDILMFRFDAAVSEILRVPKP